MNSNLEQIPMEKTYHYWKQAPRVLNPWRIEEHSSKPLFPALLTSDVPIHRPGESLDHGEFMCFCLPICHYYYH